MGKRFVIDLTDEQAREYAEWTEAVAFRIVDLERVTRPGAE